MAKLLEVKNLITQFKVDKTKIISAVDKVSFSIDEGETLAIVGESGSGKSVTALSVMQLVPNPPGHIEGGEIFFQGEDLLKMSPAQMREVRGNKISMIFQEPMTSLNPVLTVGEQIAEALDKTMHFKTVTLYPGPSGQTYSWLGVEVLGGVSAKELSEALLDLDPGIVVGNWEWHNGITINPLNMEPEEVPVLIEGVLACYDRLAKGGKTA